MNPEILTLLLIAVFAGGLLGWDLAIHNYRRGRRSLERRTAQVEQDAAAFRAEERVDPQRAWIDAGKRSVVNQVDSTLQTIRKDLDS